MNRALFAFLLVLASLALTGLKFTGFPDLSWWWITAPLWGPMVLAVLIALLIFFYALISTLYAKPH